MPSSYTLEDAQQFEQARDLLKAADIYYELGEFERAKALYLALERQQPFHKHIKFKLGQLLTRIGVWDEAIVKLQEVRDAGIFLDDTLYLLAECFQQKGLIYAARELYVDLLERNYQYKDAREKLHALDTPGVSSLTTILPGSSAPSDQPAKMDESQTLQGLPVEDRYILMEELGRGGMGVVYKALEKPSDRPVAIKVLPPYLAQDEMNRVRFFREAEIVARLRHPHIVQILETNQQENFIVMEYVPGGTLNVWIAQHNVPKSTLLRFLLQVLDALHVAHEQGIIHRDLKPENILIADEQTAKLTDFGIAHICGATITHTGMHLGTLPYMSPEQILGREIDRRSDIYAVGVLLYKLMTGKLPFTGQETSYHHIHTPPRPPHELVPTLSPKLDAIILKCLAKRPEDRFANGKLLQRALMTYGAPEFC